MTHVISLRHNRPREFLWSPLVWALTFLKGVWTMGPILKVVYIGVKVRVYEDSELAAHTRGP